MEQSTEITELAKALSRAQSAMGGAKKDSDNPFFKSKYADLESVWAACRQQLTDNGLCVVQGASSSVDASLIVIVTQLIHDSGQWMRETLTLKPSKLDAQGAGSAISYGRRYALAAMVGIYQVDDDAESATNRKPMPVTRKLEAPTVDKSESQEVATVYVENIDPSTRASEPLQFDLWKERLEIAETQGELDMVAVEVSTQADEPTKAKIRKLYTAAKKRVAKADGQ